MTTVIIVILCVLILCLVRLNVSTAKQYDRQWLKTKAYENLLLEIQKKSREPSIKLMARKRYK